MLFFLINGLYSVDQSVLQMEDQSLPCKLHNVSFPTDVQFAVHMRKVCMFITFVELVFIKKFLKRCMGYHLQTDGPYLNCSSLNRNTFCLTPKWQFFLNFLAFQQQIHVWNKIKHSIWKIFNLNSSWFFTTNEACNAYRYLCALNYINWHRHIIFNCT